MGTISKDKKRRVRWFGRTQLKYAMAYILITSVVLVFLNLYAASMVRSLIFRSKQTNWEDKANLAASAFSDVETLKYDDVSRVMHQLGSFNATRILVTDASGLVVYDTLEAYSAQGQYALLAEVVQALEGNDVFYVSYADGKLESHAASPILDSGKLLGSVYMMEFDTDQGALIQALQNYIFRLSAVLETAVILFSVIFSEAFSLRMRRIFASMRIIREGDYSHKMQVRGHDELAVLSSEFNALTDRLQASENRRRQFVSDASHELKTPLTSIKLLADSILQNDMDDGTIREFVGDISSEADRLTRMSQKLLSLTKIDTGKEEEREIAEISETVVKVFRMLAPVAALHEITLVNQAPPGMTALMMEDDLYQIIFNLVENGIKYNRPGGSLTVDLERQGEDLVLSVTDTGVGIPQESIPYIFDRFYRVDKARSRQAGGSGLGLSIVHDMVMRNMGSISVEQPAEGGSRFVVVFPAFDLGEDSQ